MNQTQKHTTGKKFLALLLALIMSVSLLPMSVFAADLEQTDVDGQPAVEQGVEDAVPGETDGQEADTTVPEEPVEDVQEPADAEPVEEDNMVTLEDQWLHPASNGVAPYSLPAADGYEYSIMFLDCGRKYFSVREIEQIIDNAAAAGFNYIQLAVGNDGLRFLLDDMSLTVNGTTYESSKVSSAIHSGNEAYYNFTTDELTQSEMDDIISYANEKGMDVIPCINSPGHMDAILDAAEALTKKTCAYNSSARTIDVTNTTAVAFTQALLQKYIDYFAGKGCKLFNMGADEYANDIYTTGAMGFGNLQSTGKYSHYVQYVNQVAAMIKKAGMTPMAFNDGIYFKSDTSSGTFDTDIMICYWSSGFNASYVTMPAADLASKGHKLINTHGDYYWVLGKSDWQCSAEKAEGFAYKSFQGSTIDKPAGAMFCIWCDYPGAGTAESVISATAETIAAFGARLPNATPAQTVYDNTETTENDGGATVTVTAPGLTRLTATKVTTGIPAISNAAEDKVIAYDVKPSVGNTAYKEEGTVAITIPDGWDSEKVRGFVVNDDNTVDAGLTGTVVADKFQFKAPHFSTMGIYELSESGTVKKTITVIAGTTATDTIDGVYSGTPAVGDTTIATVTGEVMDTKRLTPVSAIESGKSYLIVNQRTNLMLTKNSITDWNSKTGLKLLGEAKPDATENLWTITASGSNYYVQSGNNYLKISNASTSNTTSSLTSSRTTTNLSYEEDGTWRISQSGSYLNNLGGGNQTGGYYTSTDEAKDDKGSKWLIYEITTSDTKQTVFTFKGVSEGKTTATIQGESGTVEYTIIVLSAAMADVDSLPVEYWITNRKVTAGGAEGMNITVTAPGVYSQAGAKFSDLVPATGTYEGKDLVFWKGTRLLSANEQTTTTKTDQTNAGNDFTYIHYWNDAWAFSADGESWTEFNTTDQVVAYYLQKTDVTKEVTSYVKDWGFSTAKDTDPNSQYEGGQVALTVAVVYPDGSVHPTEEEMYSTSTTIFNYWKNRDIGLVAPENNSDYTIAKITVTDGTRDKNTSDNGWYTTDTITWKKTTTEAGDEWYDETTVWDEVTNAGTRPMVDGQADDGIIWSAKNTAKLVLIYLKPVEKEGNLNVVYYDDNAGKEIISTQIVMAYTDVEPTFTTALKDRAQSDEVIGATRKWPGKTAAEEGYLPDTAYVTNGSNNKQYFNKVLAQVPGVTGFYKSGIYEYVSADISEDGKTLTLHYNLRDLEGKTFVVDFGLPIVIPFSDFSVENDAEITRVSFAANDETLTEKQGEYGFGKIDTENRTVTYTLNRAISSRVAVPIFVWDTGTPVQLTVYVIPASTVYYEDSFAKFYNSNGVEQTSFDQTTATVAMGTWYVDGDELTSMPDQALEELGKKNNVYGYDPAYTQGNNSTTFSMGSAKKVTVNADVTTNPTAQFTFKGTGFDVISLTDNRSGAIAVDVYSGTTVNEKNWVKGFFVNNYYGYEYNSDSKTWVVNTENGKNALYQIPVIKYSGLTYGEYTVVITPAYDKVFDKTGTDSYSFWLDAVRVYNPMGESYDYKTDENNDNESYPQFIKLRDKLAKSGGVTADAVFIDGGPTADISIYANYGPNNEVYLANGQAISFKVAANDKIASIQIGAKAPQSNAKLEVTGATLDSAKTDGTINTATEMYYVLNGAAGETVTITNRGTGILSLTNLKITFKSEATAELEQLTTLEQTEAVAAVRALFATPVEPEPDPEPVTFEPDRFEVSWNRSTVKVGQKATLTVKTSEDVEAITVDGETVTSYRTRTQRTGWGWNAKKVTYREFTYTVTAAEAGTLDVSVAAVNAEGVSSAAVTATVTVQAASQRPGIGGWLDNIFGRWF